MKNYIILNKFLIAAFWLCAAGCTKDFKEINTDPTLITQDKIKPSLLLTTVLKNTVFDIVNHGTISNFSGYYTAPDQGNVFLDRDFGGNYNSYYRGNLINIAEIIRLTANDPALSNENAIARIWKVWLFHQLTDQFGDIPYFSAVKDIDNMDTHPVYDKQEDIYKDMLKELKEAAAQLSDDASQKSFGGADILLGGNVDRWRRFANSLRFRLAMRVRYADEALAKQHITEVLTAPLIDDNLQNVSLATLNDGNTANRNFLYDKNLRVPGNMSVSFTVTDNLIRLNDPRLPVFAKPASAAGVGYRGVPLQITGVFKQRYSADSISLMGDYFLQPVFAIVVMSAAEVKQLRAEAALSNITDENPQELFAAGIQAAMDQYGIASGAASAYISSAAGTLAGTDEEKLEQIIVQKWLSTYYNVNEGWAEFRRTGYPRIWTGNEQGDTQGNIPRRLTYPTDEYLKNAANVSEAAGRLSGGDKLLSKVWWDKKAGLPFYHPKQGIFPPEQ